MLPLQAAEAVAQDSTEIHSKAIDLFQTVTSTPADELFRWATEMVVSFGTKIVLALIVYIIGNWIIKRLAHSITNISTKRGFDLSLTKFFVSMTTISLSIVLILTSIGILGINTSSFLAIFASAGLAIGMALSGTLQNFAGGVMILFLKPFKIGDVIEAQGNTGCVKEISLFSTLLNTPDNKMIMIPNGPLANGIINNYSKESTRRVDWTVSVAYGTDYDRVQEVVTDVLTKNSLVLKENGVFVELNTFGASSLDFAVRAWSKSEDYWTLYFQFNKEVYKRFATEGIEFPFPQMDVTIKK